MLTWFEHVMTGIPPWIIHALISGVVMLESMGIPLPGETVIIAAAVLSTGHFISVSPLAIAISAAIGAVVGDSIGYWVVREYGNGLLRWLHRKFPSHVGAEQLAWTEHVFSRYGFLAVFFGRFIALLRMFAGPISGLLRMHYYVFLIANALGGVSWSFGITYAVYYLGMAADRWLSSAAWVGLVIFVALAVVVSVLLRRRTERLVHDYCEQNPDAVERAQGRLA